MTYKELTDIHERATKILSSGLDWAVKFELIFSPEISHKLAFKWYSPEMYFEDNVKAFMSAFDKYMEQQKNNRNRD